MQILCFSFYRMEFFINLKTLINTLILCFDNIIVTSTKIWRVVEWLWCNMLSWLPTVDKITKITCLGKVWRTDRPGKGTPIQSRVLLQSHAAFPPQYKVNMITREKLAQRTPCKDGCNESLWRDLMTVKAFDILNCFIWSSPQCRQINPVYRPVKQVLQKLNRELFLLFLFKKPNKKNFFTSTGCPALFQNQYILIIHGQCS